MAKKGHKSCKCGMVKGTKRCRKTIRKGAHRGKCPKRPRR